MWYGRKKISVTFVWRNDAQVRLVLSSATQSVDLSTQKNKTGAPGFLPRRPALFCSAGNLTYGFKFPGDSPAHTMADLRYNLMAVAKKNRDVSVPPRRSCLFTCPVHQELGNGNPQVNSAGQGRWTERGLQVY